MTVADLKRILAQCKPDSLVFVRLDDEALDNPRGFVFEILGHEYGYGCTESLALMLECGQPDQEEEPPCECVPADKRRKAIEAEDEARSAARIPFLLGEDPKDWK